MTQVAIRKSEPLSPELGGENPPVWHRMGADGQTETNIPTGYVLVIAYEFIDGEYKAVSRRLEPRDKDNQR